MPTTSTSPLSAIGVALILTGAACGRVGFESLSPDAAVTDAGTARSDAAFDAAPPPDSGPLADAAPDAPPPSDSGPLTDAALTGPTLAVTFPDPALTGTVRITGTAAAGRGIGRFSVNLWDDDYYVVLDVVDGLTIDPPAPSYPFDVSIDTTRVPNGRYAISVFVNDAVGTGTSNSRSGFRIDNPVDIGDVTPPVISPEFPSASTLGSSITLAGTATDAAGIRWMSMTYGTSTSGAGPTFLPITPATVRHTFLQDIAFYGSGTTEYCLRVIGFDTNSNRTVEEQCGYFAAP